MILHVTSYYEGDSDLFYESFPPNQILLPAPQKNRPLVKELSCTGYDLTISFRLFLQVNCNLFFLHHLHFALEKSHTFCFLDLLHLHLYSYHTSIILGEISNLHKMRFFGPKILAIFYINRIFFEKN